MGSGTGGEPASLSRAIYAPPARTLSSVIKRLSHIVAGRTQVSILAVHVIK